MKCPKCNSEVNDGMKFCPKCGAEIPQKRICPNCGTEMKEGMHFCPSCGNSFEKKTVITGVVQQEQISTSIDKGKMSKVYIIIGLILLALPGLFFALKPSSDTPQYNKTDGSEVINSELIEAVNHHHEIANKMGTILPQINRVLREYGNGQMGFMAAAQNNPNLFRTFESLNDDIERSFDRLIRTCEKIGEKELASEYRYKKKQWDESVLRLRGYY